MDQCAELEEDNAAREEEKKFCRSHKNELSFIKSSFAMFMERLFHEMGVSFNKIQVQSAKHRLKMKMKLEMKMEMNYR